MQGFVDNIETLTTENTDFRRVLYTGKYLQLVLMALQPEHLAKAIVGMKQLARNGLRYPIAPYGIQADVRAGMGVSYAKK